MSAHLYRPAADDDPERSEQIYRICLWALGLALIACVGIAIFPPSGTSQVHPLSPVEQLRADGFTNIQELKANEVVADVLGCPVKLFYQEGRWELVYEPKGERIINPTATIVSYTRWHTLCAVKAANPPDPNLAVVAKIEAPAGK